jgi:hypothetical protein
MSDTPQQPPTTQSKLTAAQNVQYGLPFSTEWGAVSVDGVQLLCLRIEHATGMHILPMPPELAEQIFGHGVRLARQMQGKPTEDLIIATLSDVHKLAGPVVRRSNGTPL